ncbi:MAG: alpha/beta fold hydrolase [Acidobacteriota bacterium]|nr:alpha/beta fold hydrolase [Acidobacteriota bacterium]MDH3786719.1 alpha/beta fold hydrolase [Acidobacteriota bacterium]
MEDPRSTHSRFLLTLLLRIVIVLALLPSQLACRTETVTVPAADEEVAIATESPDVTLAGTLSLPAGNEPHPAVLLLTGSGGHTRDQVISGTPMFKVIGDYLVDRGLAVLRVDDRGTGDSSGPSVRESTMDDRAADARAAFRYLLERPEIDATRVGLLGHSEGAMTGPRLAVEEPRVSFLVLLAPPSVPGAEIWVRQQGDMLRREGEMPEQQIAAIESALTDMVVHIGQEGNTDDGFYRYGRAACLAWGDPPREVTPEFVSEAFGDLRQPWYRQFFSSDPQEALRELDRPVLALFGGADQQVIVDQNVAALEAGLRAAGNESFTVTVLPDEDHFFLGAPGLAPNEHVHGQMLVSQSMLQAVASWIELRTDG